jgi:hypothetical protein
MVSPHEFFAKTFPQEWDAMRRFWRIAWRISRAISIMAAIGISVPAAIGAFLVGKWTGTTNIYNNISAPPPPPDASASSNAISSALTAKTIAPRPSSLIMARVLPPLAAARRAKRDTSSGPSATLRLSSAAPAPALLSTRPTLPTRSAIAFPPPTTPPPGLRTDRASSRPSTRAEG